MIWQPSAIIEDFEVVARLAGVELPAESITIEKLPAPHKAPANLPSDKMAVYVFSRGLDVLKVGKVGPKSQARYTSQHYSPASAQSTLAASLLADRVRLGIGDADEANIGQWIKENVDRVNFLIDADLGVPVLTLLESFLQCRLKPSYEGFKSQRR